MSYDLELLCAEVSTECPTVQLMSHRRTRKATEMQGVRKWFFRL
jgi:hypothetical protein